MTDDKELTYLYPSQLNDRRQQIPDHEGKLAT